MMVGGAVISCIVEIGCKPMCRLSDPRWLCNSCSSASQKGDMCGMSVGGSGPHRRDVL